ncbi:hypothetical protein NDU88_000005 [Pleurodeles waltl]|uniref:Uncharacterized protein n=1 Tax=Pleurodeles waltl TaxID=8319 RepID=A0AAV7VS84_PLEWA|nr:hypothetical protein NDU88_000005 [Pleurodeles waltl]
MVGQKPQIYEIEDNEEVQEEEDTDDNLLQGASSSVPSRARSEDSQSLSSSDLAVSQKQYCVKQAEKDYRDKLAFISLVDEEIALVEKKTKIA